VIVGPLSRAFYLAGSSFVLLIAAALGLLAATGVSLRDATLGVRQLARGAMREVGQLLRVSAARLRMRLAARSESRAESHREEEREGIGEPRRAPRPVPRVTPPRRAKAGEPEVVEHRVVAPAPLRQEPLPFADGPARVRTSCPILTCSRADPSRARTSIATR
jgi:hypothetical protein